MVEQAAPAEPVYSETADPVFAAEHTHIAHDGGPLFGLAISGGGIRSASFALGLLQALYGFGVFEKFHYLSTVSGGGYIGGALTYFRNAFTDFGADWFPFGYLRRRDGAVQVQAMAVRVGAEDPDPANARARQIVSYLRQHASYMTPSRIFSQPALIAGVLRCLVSTLVPYFAILSGLIGLLVWTGFFDKCLLETSWLRQLLGASAAVQSAACNLEPALEGEITPFYLAVWPAGLAIALGAILVIVFVASSVVAGIVHTADRDEHAAESRYVSLIYFYSGSGEVLLAAGILLAFSTLPWLHDYLNDLLGAGGELPANFAALFAAIGGALGLVGKLRGVLAGNATQPSALRAIGMALAGILFVYGIMLLAYGAAVDLLGAMSQNRAGGAASYWWPAITAAAGLIAAFFVNINHATQHRIYRDRLMEVFCAEKDAIGSGEWQPARRAQSSDGWLINMTSRRRPYHLINTCLVTTDSNKRRFRGRGGDNFVLSPLFCGSDATGWVATAKGMRTLSIATAMAISGAALNAHSGPHGTGLLRNKAYAAVLSLLGLNLGYWARNPLRYKDGADPKFHMPTLLRPGIAALAGRRLNEIGRYVQLSDGGHFENLAIYELIRRKVRFLWVSDAGQDLGFGFEDLANAIERIRVDFGVNIRFRREPYDLTHLIPGSAGADSDATLNFVTDYKLARRGYAIGTIEYPDAPHGVIVYVKSTLTLGLPGDLYGYKKRNADFPHQTTLDQFFDEDQFEAYRELGYRLSAQLFRDIEERRRENAPLPPELETVARVVGF
jgi:hypothetical protein